MTTTSEPRKHGLRPTVRVQAACFSEGRLLCARHRKRGGEYRVLPGGHVDPGESLMEALVRELREETRLELREARLWALGEFHSSRRHVLDCTFFATGWDGRPSLGSDPEAVGGATLVGLEWLERDRLETVAFRPAILAERLLERWADPEAPAAYLGVERA